MTEDETAALQTGQRSFRGGSFQGADFSGTVGASSAVISCNLVVFFYSLRRFGCSILEVPPAS